MLRNGLYQWWIPFSVVAVQLERFTGTREVFHGACQETAIGQIEANGWALLGPFHVRSPANWSHGESGTFANPLAAGRFWDIGCIDVHRGVADSLSAWV